MTGEQPGTPVEEFARFLRGLTRLLDETAGWYGVFTLRDPEGMRACLDGEDVPPWDVVASLLHDLAGRRGEHCVRTAGPRARRLHEEAVAAYDARPDAPGRLGDRLDVMLRERQYAALRERELLAALRAAADGPGAERLTDELAWARDDHVRSGARARELQGRIDALAERAAARRFPGGAAGPAPDAGGAGSGEVPWRPTGARFAGLEVMETPESPGAPDGSGSPGWDTSGSPAGEPVAAPRPAPRGARFAGADEAGPADGPGAPHPARGPREPAPPPPAPLPPRTSTSATRLARLRAAGRGGEAHALLCAAAHAHPAGLPVLIGELEYAGLAAEVPTLLWEAACLPPARLAAAADALAAAGRTAESARLLRQGVARPVEEVAHTALALLGAGRPAQARELFAALVRARTPEEAVEAAASAPDELTPLLLDAAAGVSPHRHRDITHALRVGGAG
ncbi:hypothetical protein A6A06_18545 [Streptomyces sp. CB02923]|uniref:hypothetical protein n=1 Tax=Streptomyces sp. CB02923 TaxID=1718985 RepID=UPI00093F900B|nr:hypothetical protein [Streptomyces sp. CB02923]OKI00901.1 hypothetical protein A6A06_18545 [Streptomyces sp. CB02923]